MPLTTVFSISKGLLTLCAYLANQQGLLDFDAPVVSVWPESGVNGKRPGALLRTSLAGPLSVDAWIDLGEAEEFRVAHMEPPLPSTDPTTTAWLEKAMSMPNAFGPITLGGAFPRLLTDESIADADVHLGFAYVNNQMGGVVDGRANRLTHALRSCLGQ